MNHDMPAFWGIRRCVAPKKHHRFPQAKLQHSVFYAANTSEIKDDIQALVDNFKGAGGKVLSKVEAGFLLWCVRCW